LMTKYGSVTQPRLNESHPVSNRHGSAQRK
jgi:hypothetical protein